jgi:RNA polymerase sigma factor (sigma-70 family)
VYSSPFFDYRYNKNGRPKLLTAVEEVELAKIIEAGVLAEEKLAQMAAAKDGDLPETRQLRQDLSVLVKEGRRAFNFFVMANDRLAWAEARKRFEQGLEAGDFAAMAHEGLIRAVKMFDYTLGYKFSTYAKRWWICKYVDRGTEDTARNIQLPRDVHLLLKSVSRVKRGLLRDLGREPTTAEIAKELGLKPEKLAEKLEGTENTISLDQPVGHDPDADTLLGYVKDRKLPDVFTQVDTELTNRALRRRLKTLLTPREQIAIRALTDEDADPADLPPFLGMPAVAVRRLIQRARDKLAHPSSGIDSVISLSGAGDWRRYALCKNANRLAGFSLDFFALPNTTSEAEAKAACRHCPAASFCLDVALECGFVNGVWGGMTEDERTSLMRAQNKRRHGP